ncbi:MAG: hypothetical protein L7F78_05015, partial [Syntrophales bacterium LBB04]|nr:hypothetical protein [Syntrophales bacterium LBB04]
LIEEAKKITKELIDADKDLREHKVQVLIASIKELADKLHLNLSQDTLAKIESTQQQYDQAAAETGQQIDEMLQDAESKKEEYGGEQDDDIFNGHYMLNLDDDIQKYLKTAPEDDPIKLAVKKVDETMKTKNDAEKNLATMPEKSLGRFEQLKVVEAAKQAFNEAREGLKAAIKNLKDNLADRTSDQLTQAVTEDLSTGLEANRDEPELEKLIKEYEDKLPAGFNVNNPKSPESEAAIKNLQPNEWNKIEGEFKNAKIPMKPFDNFDNLKAALKDDSQYAKETNTTRQDQIVAIFNKNIRLQNAKSFVAARENITGNLSNEPDAPVPAPAEPNPKPEPAERTNPYGPEEPILPTPLAATEGENLSQEGARLATNTETLNKFIEKDLAKLKAKPEALNGLNKERGHWKENNIAIMKITRSEDLVKNLKGSEESVIKYIEQIQSAIGMTSDKIDGMTGTQTIDALKAHIANMPDPAPIAAPTDPAPDLSQGPTRGTLPRRGGRDGTGSDLKPA